ALGVIVTLSGVAVVASKGDVDVILSLALNHGDLLMLIAALFYSAYTVAIRVRPDVPGEALFTLFAVIAAFAAIPMAVWETTTEGFYWPTATGWGLTVIVAIFPSCLAQLFFLRGVDLIGPARAGVYINLVPIFAAILAVIVLGEVFAAYHGLALALVLGGIWLAQRK
ncbi:MAG: DMT family transporter, partial [Pseudomonadota bacterium]